MRRLLLSALSLALAAGLSIGTIGARPVDFCDRHPEHQRCQTVTPTPSPVPTATVAPTTTPTASAIPTATPQPTATATPNPTDCTAYPEPRVYIEAQSWWHDDALIIPHQVGEHVHLGACWPVYGTILSGDFRVDMRVIVHEATPGRTVLGRLRGGASSGGGGTGFDLTSDIAIPLDQNGNGQRTFTHVFDTRAMESGTREIRLSAMLYPFERRQFESTGWRVCVRSCSSSTAVTTARGWYHEHGYQNAYLRTPIPSAPLTAPWTPTVWMVPGADGLPTVQHMAVIDPDFHNGSAGLVLREGSGPYQGPLTIDPVTLESGPHKLVLLASDGKLAGVLVIPFEVP